MGGMSGGKSSPTSPPSTEWNSIDEYILRAELDEIDKQTKYAMYAMQAQFATKMTELQAGSVLPPVPEITPAEDIDWTSKIDEMEALAREDIADLTSWGASSGTITTSPLVWEEEPTVLSKTLLGE